MQETRGKTEAYSTHCMRTQHNLLQNSYGRKPKWNQYKRVGHLTYKLDLPGAWRRVHPVISVQHLEPTLAEGDDPYEREHGKGPTEDECFLDETDRYNVEGLSYEEAE
ncbi:uncharacterized protein N7511_004439 [Penicillium nucicola]|uniref:uncharacterized protein n=1 Tax=Penicillium nucicola TaxID=1850975 RepID=UPI002544DA1C|nr:uncharacterized protein N7511_004439 [Penicillium nucicola]KAJ5766823.1 hypothetical protein N7511_004439 [Penicillium nucicola]